MLKRQINIYFFPFSTSHTFFNSFAPIWIMFVNSQKFFTTFAIIILSWFRTTALSTTSQTLWPLECLWNRRCFQCNAIACNVVVGVRIWSGVTCASKVRADTASGMITLYTNGPVLCKMNNLLQMIWCLFTKNNVWVVQDFFLYFFFTLSFIHRKFHHMHM